MLSALDLLADLEAGRTSPAAIHDRVAEAIAAREPTVKAFAALGLEAARQAAERAKGPLAGLPLGVKDVIDTADLPSEYGSPIYAGWRPKADAAVVNLARRAGAVVVGKTRTTEFANLNPTVTTNPHDPAHTPGGSSSGSAAAVAAGEVAFAFGTQTAGSVIRPAAFCGVAAIKPSYRLLPTVGIKTWSWHLDHIGLFAATVADCAVVLAGLTGRDLRIDGVDLGAPRIGVIRGYQRDGAEPALDAALDRVADVASAAGASVRDVHLPTLFEEAYVAQTVIMDVEGALSLGWELDTHPDKLSPVLREGLERGRARPVAEYDRARGTAHAARRALADVFGDVDVLLLPSAPGAAPRTLTMTGDPRFNRLWTLMGAPAVNVPGLRDSSGMPMGVQIVAPFRKDREALAAAAFVERIVRRTG